MSTTNETEQETSIPTPTEPTIKARGGRRLQFDEHGHAIPPTEAEMEDDRKALLLALEEMAAVPDDPNESDEEFWRAMDAERPERPLFRELYEP